MTHFAKIENNIVTQVIVADQEFINNSDGEWIQTSPDTFAGQNTKGTPLRKNYAGIGYTYDRELDAFIPPKPYESWLLDTNTCRWNPPIDIPEAMKNGEKLFTWDEGTVSWKEVLPTSQ